MTAPKKITQSGYFTAAAIAGMLLWVPLAGAADTPGDWRKTYDMVLMWVNFGIFVFLIVKFLRVPIKNFISGKQKELERKIQRLEEDKAAADQKIQDILKTVDESQAEFESLKKKIIEQGERKKQEIIEDAQDKSRVMLEDAKLRVDNQIVRAKKMLKAELVDAAVELALEKLPNKVTEADNQRLIQDYLASASAR